MRRVGSTRIVAQQMAVIAPQHREPSVRTARRSRGMARADVRGEIDLARIVDRRRPLGQPARE
jgi:hypothetical protein